MKLATDHQPMHKLKIHRNLLPYPLYAFMVWCLGTGETFTTILPYSNSNFIFISNKLHVRINWGTDLNPLPQLTEYKEVKRAHHWINVHLHEVAQYKNSLPPLTMENLPSTLIQK
jgi:hypothetical protein